MIHIEPEILAKYVALQAETKCPKCKGTEWSLREKRDIAMGGDRVGKFVVLGHREDEIAVIVFDCKGCSHEFRRPAYSRAQLSTQQFPAIQLDEPTGKKKTTVKLEAANLDVRAEEEPAPKKKTARVEKGKTSKLGKTKRHEKGENGTSP